ncbi:hypothetical protein ACFLQO_00250 [Candidatus Aenigmatarchaeota archaeon]
MVDKKLMEYVKMNLEKGYPIQMIRKALQGSEWHKPEIDEVLALVQGKKPPAPKPVPNKPPPPTPTEPATGSLGLPYPKPHSKGEMIKLLIHGPHPHPKHPPGHPGNKKAKAGFVVSLIAGILMLITSAANLLVSFVGFPYNDLELIYTLGVGTIIPQDPSFIINSILTPFGQILTILGFILGVFVIIGSILMRKSGMAGSGGKIVLICSILNILALWGLGLMGLVSAILGVIGGILGIKRK